MAEPFRYDALPVFDAFEQVSQPAIYTPLPDNWVVGATDVVSSTDALLAGRYKAVNMAGASVVSAVMNGIGHQPFPFVFGGDGAVLATGPQHVATVRDAMAKTIRFVEEDLGLALRAGMLPVAAIREAGYDVRVARYAASPEAVYAMFSGGGCNYLESELKAGRIAIEPAPPGERPDLSGLSCRWSPIQSRHGLILSVLVLPAAGALAEEFRKVAAEVIAVLGREDRDGHPVAPVGPRFSMTGQGLLLEGKVKRKRGWAGIATLKVAVQTAAVMAFDRAGQKLGPFDPEHYRKWVARNTDFRKFEDGLRMTVDCSAETADTLDRLLAGAEAEGIVDYGLHRQDAALMTCIVPSPLRDDHLHFLDGAGGGYALSAQALKQRQAERLRSAALQ